MIVEAEIAGSRISQGAEIAYLNFSDAELAGYFGVDWK